MISPTLKPRVAPSLQVPATRTVFSSTSWCIATSSPPISVASSVADELEDLAGLAAPDHGRRRALQGSLFGRQRLRSAV